MTMEQCPQCHQFIGSWYCRLCNADHWKNNFDNWTSGDSTIDEIIQKSQLFAKAHYQLIEWIEFKNLKNMEHMADGGFGKVYKAVWEAGPLTNFDPVAVNNHPFWN